MTCDQFQAMWEMKRRDALPDRDCGPLQQHLERCGQCRAYGDSASRLDDALRRTLDAAARSIDLREARRRALTRLRRYRVAVFAIVVQALLPLPVVLWLMGVGWFLAVATIELIVVAGAVAFYLARVRVLAGRTRPGDYFARLREDLDATIRRTRILAPILVPGATAFAVWEALEIPAISSPLRVMVKCGAVLSFLLMAGVGVYMLKVQLPRLRRERSELE